MSIIRLLTYNILLGGARREERIASVLRRSRADVIALQEVRNDGLVDRLAEQLGMAHVYGSASDGGELGLAVLSRLALAGHRNHRHPTMLRSHLEVTIQVRRGVRIGLHVVHLAARFGDRSKGEARRLRELEALLGDIATTPAIPHLIAGDFNTLAPGDDLEATGFFRRMAELRRARLLVRQADGWVGPASAESVERSLDESWLAHGIDPGLRAGVPVLPGVVGPLTAWLPQSRALDGMLGRMIERWVVPRLVGAGYVDCYRHLHPRAHGYTCATWLPAARVDYVFASPELVPKLIGCDVLRGHGRTAAEVANASDHFPLVAELDL